MSKVNTKSNHEIISIIANAKGYLYNGENIFTYAEWKERGFSIIRGEKEFARTYLWTRGINKRFVQSSIFTIDQVIRMSVKSLVVV